MRHHSKFKFLYFIPLVLAGLVLIGFVTMFLWNALLPVIFHFPVITFWQAIGLLALTRLLFGSFCHHGRGHHHPWGHDFHHKLENMTPEEREQFMKMRQTYRTSWEKYCPNKKEENITDTFKGPGSSDSVKE